MKKYELDSKWLQWFLGFNDASPTKPKLIRGFGQKALQQRELSRTTNTGLVV